MPSKMKSKGLRRRSWGIRIVIWSAALGGAVVTVVLFLLQAGGNGGEGDGSPGSVREITVKMTDRVTFEPSEIKLKAGEPVRLVIDNSESSATHDFSVMVMPVAGVMVSGSDVHGTDMHGMGHESDASMSADEMALHLALEAKAMGAIEFTPLESGEFGFECTVPGHSEAGMIGTIVVT